jgi:hypothetical protein
MMLTAAAKGEHGLLLTFPQSAPVHSSLLDPKTLEILWHMVRTHSAIKKRRPNKTQRPEDVLRRFTEVRRQAEQARRNAKEVADKSRQLLRKRILALEWSYECVVSSVER